MSPISKEEAEFECMIGSIRWCAKDNKYTSEQSREIWEQGMVVCFQAGKIPRPIEHCQPSPLEKM